MNTLIEKSYLDSFSQFKIALKEAQDQGIKYSSEEKEIHEWISQHAEKVIEKFNASN